MVSNHPQPPSELGIEVIHFNKTRYVHQHNILHLCFTIPGVLVDLCPNGIMGVWNLDPWLSMIAVVDDSEVPLFVFSLPHTHY